MGATIPDLEYVPALCVAEARVEAQSIPPPPTDMARSAERRMARFFFDFHDAGGIFVDGAGEELPNAAIARKEALETVGQAIKDLTFHHSDGRVVIEVRDREGPVLRVSALIETTSLRE